MLLNADSLRRMYPGGRGNTTARRFARWWSFAFSIGLAPRRWVTLEVRGRRSGATTRFPLGMADHQGDWYLVSMLGDCNWVRNVQAADGHATIRHGFARPCRLIEVPAGKRAPVLRCYLQKVPGARPHIPVSPDAPSAGFEAIAAAYPVFRIETTSGAPAGLQRNRHRLRWLSLATTSEAPP